MITRSFHAGRTTGTALPRVSAWSWLKTMGSSFGACSVSTRIQSKPESAMTSAARLLQRLDQRPIWGRPARMACLNELIGSWVSMMESSVVRVALLMGENRGRVEHRNRNVRADDGPGTPREGMRARIEEERIRSYFGPAPGLKVPTTR